MKGQKQTPRELSRIYTLSVTANATGTTTFEDAIKKVDSFNNISDVWAIYQHLKRPDDLPPKIDYNLV